jgi:hypothetical protein
MSDPKYWTIERDWPEATAFIVAGGASLRGFDFERLRGRKVIAINQSIFSIPFADLLHFSDRRWYAEYQPQKLIPYDRISTNSPTVNEPRIKTLRRVEPPPGLVDDPQTVPMKWTSLQPAMQIAVHRGASRIVLLGADCHTAKDGRKHHHQEYQWEHLAKPQMWDLQKECLSHMVRPLQKRQIEVINTSLESALPWWPKIPIEDALRLGD